jgi:hypothetical protein
MAPDGIVAAMLRAASRGSANVVLA